ncbi:MAG: hypothetical protein BroJett011_09190 [Chloroflexota bacterium]|nr:MAG: hypothetical protein BroJett011_09190 [Chloroflexota bacterium]
MMNDSILFNADSETAAQAVTALLTRQGYRVLRSFDLRSALAAHGDCACPYHGTTHCTCQFVVLLVYSAAAGPVVITAHSYDAQTRLRLVQDALTQPDPHLARQVMAALKETALVYPDSTPSLTEVCQC